MSWKSIDKLFNLDTAYLSLVFILSFIVMLLNLCVYIVIKFSYTITIIININIIISLNKLKIYKDNLINSIDNKYNYIVDDIKNI